MKKRHLLLACWVAAGFAFNLPANAQVTDPKQAASQGATGNANNRRVEFVKTN